MSSWGELLDQTEPFARMSEGSRRRLESLGSERSVPADAYIFHYGDRWPYLFLVTQGELEAVKTSVEGRSLVVLTLEPGNVFWGLTFFDDGTTIPVALRSLQDSAIVQWSREQILPFLLEDGEALWSLCGLLVRRMQQASTIVEDLAFQPVAGRIAKLLLAQHGKTGSTKIDRDLTLDDMAARVGTTREMVCRILYKFADQELIEITRTEYSIVDKGQLSKVAGQE
jgi:CRP/FNR family transcriptional regulator